MRQVRIANRTVRAALAALVVMSASGARGDERPALHLFHEVGFALSFPTGVVTALSYAPTVSAFDGRLNVALGARFSANFDGGGVPYPNGSADLLAAGAHNVLTVARPRTQALNLMFGLSGRLYRGLEAGLDIDLVLAEKSVRQKRLERRCVRRVRSERVEPAFLGLTRSMFRTRRELALENLALRQQPAVLIRTRGSRRLRLGVRDRAFWRILSE